MRRNTARLAIAAVTTGLLLVAPGAARAANTFVDDDRPDNSGDCLTPATACQTISGATGGVAKAGAGDTVWVDGGVYLENVNLDLGKSLIEADFNGLDTDSEAVVDGGAGPAVVATVSGAGVIQGFTLRSASTAVEFPGTGQLSGSLLDSTGNGSSGISVSADDVTITGNLITDDTNPFEHRMGVIVNVGADDVTITGNQFSNLTTGLFLSNTGDDADVIGNEFTGTRQVPAPPGIAIHVFGGADPTLIANHIHSPGSGVLVGVLVATPSSATLRRNRVFGHTNGVVANDSLALTLSNDVLKDSPLTGLRAGDPAADGGGDVTATNVTFAGNGTDVFLEETLLTLSSSIVEDPIGAAGTAACVITFSRGPTTTPGGDGCMDFQTTAAPGFGADGYHLGPFSPLIDLGDPAAPVPPDDVDIDGQPRAADENCDGIARRNIGADEFSRGCTVSPLPAAALSSGPPQQATGKKKKCKRKKKGAAAAKKCRRKKK